MYKFRKHEQAWLDKTRHYHSVHTKKSYVMACKAYDKYCLDSRSYNSSHLNQETYDVHYNDY